MVGDLAVERYNGTGGGRVNKHWPSDRVGKAKRDVCLWSVDLDGVWSGRCGVKWNCEYETPKDNGMNFCPCCGKRLKQKGGAK